MQSHNVRNARSWADVQQERGLRSPAGDSPAQFPLRSPPTARHRRVLDAAGYCSWRRPIASGLVLTPWAVSRNQQFRTLAVSSVEKNGGLLLQVTHSGR